MKRIYNFEKNYIKFSQFPILFFLFFSEDMNLLKKFLAGTASLAIALTTVSTSFAGTPSFIDTNGHWAKVYIDQLSEKGIISTHDSAGNPKRYFYPNNSLTRAELTKLAIEAFYGDAINELSEALADPSSPSFKDVASSAWFFKYVEIAKGLEIVGGFGDGTFKPYAPITRGAALKVILGAGDISDSSSNTNVPFHDIMGHWSKDYVLNAYNNCIVGGTSANTFTPNGNITRAEVAKVISNAIKVANGERVCTDNNPVNPNPNPVTDDPDLDDDDSTATDDKYVNPGDNPTVDDPIDNDPKDDDDNTNNDDVVTSGALEVSLSDETPLSKSIPSNGSGIPFTAVDLSNTSSEDIEITRLVVAHSGLGDEDGIEEIRIFDGIVQKGSGRSFSSDGEIAEINLVSDPITILAGRTKTIVLAGNTDPAYTSGEHNFVIVNPEDIVAVSAETGATVDIVGSFPVKGNTMTVINQQVGDLAFEFRGITDKTLEVGDRDVECGRINITAGSAEDLLIQSIKLEFNGSDDGAIQNIYADFLNERISKIDGQVSNEIGILDFTDNEIKGFRLDSGDSKTFSIKCDIVGGVGNDVITEVDEPKSDIIAVGLTYGFGVNIEDETTVTNEDRTFTIQGGDINFTMDSSVSDAAEDSDAVEFATITISNLGENIELENGLYFYLNENGSTADAVECSYISDVKLINKATGSSFLGTEQPKMSGSNCVVEFKDDGLVKSGETLTLSLQADVIKNSVDNPVVGKKYSFILDMGKVAIKGLDSREDTPAGCTSNCKHDVRPGSNLSSQPYTVVEAGLTVATKSLSSDDYVRKAEDKLVWHGTVRASDTEDLVVESIKFTNNPTLGTGEIKATEDDVQSFDLYIKDGDANEVLVESNKTFGDASGSYVTFSNLDAATPSAGGLLVPAGKEYDLILRANIASTARNTAKLKISIEDATNTGIDVKDAEGDDAKVNLGSTTLEGPQFSLKEKGSVAISYNNTKSPSSQIRAAGTTDVPVAVFEIEATDEDVLVRDLRVKVKDIAYSTPEVENDYQSVNKISLFYEDGTPVKYVSSGQNAKVSVITQAEADPFVADANVDGEGTAYFEGLNLIAEDGQSTYIEVRADLNEMDDQAGTTAKSGMAFQVALDLVDTNGKYADDTEIVGADSGEEFVQDFDTDLSNTVYVFNNHVTAKASASQPGTNSLNVGQSELPLIKFDLNTGGSDSDSPYLKSVKVDISGSSTALSNLWNLILVNGQGETIAKVDAIGDTAAQYTLTIGDTGDGATPCVGDAVVVCSKLTDISGAKYYEVDGNETFTIKVDTGSIAYTTDQSITSTIKINKPSPAITNYITWRDGGTNGTDGIDVPWIDLGEGNSTSQITHTIKYNN